MIMSRNRLGWIVQSLIKLTQHKREFWEVPCIGTPVLFALSRLEIILFSFLPYHIPNKAQQIINEFICLEFAEFFPGLE